LLLLLLRTVLPKVVLAQESLPQLKWRRRFWHHCCGYYFFWTFACAAVLLQRKKVPQHQQSLLPLDFPSLLRLVDARSDQEKKEKKKMKKKQQPRLKSQRH
jgi:hypothetical protein